MRSLVVACLLISTTALADPETGSLVGRVVEPGGEPAVVGASVVVESGQTMQSAVTDATGAFHFDALPAGTYAITVFVDGMPPHTDKVSVVAGRSTPRFIHLPRVAQPERISIPEPPQCVCPPPCANGRLQIDRPERAPSQVQLDLGLAIVGAAYERSLADHLAIQVELQVLSTYFAPWFGAGDRVSGIGGQIRPTYFLREDHHGLYVAPYLRVDRVTSDSAHGVGFAAGGFVGWAFGVGPLDVRVGGGAQYMRFRTPMAGVSTPFVALDLVVGYRL